MFTIKSIEEIKNEIIDGKTQVTNFSKSVNFPFDELYKEIVTKIKTIEISSECILYNSVYSMNMSKVYSDEGYWSKNTDKDNIKNYWFIGQNGQGDYWIMDENRKIYFYDHDNEEIDDIEKIIDLNIDFGKWLQYAYLNKELDKIYYENKYSKDIGKEYMEKLKEISKELMKNYPFKINNHHQRWWLEWEAPRRGRLVIRGLRPAARSLPDILRISVSFPHPSVVIQ